MAAIAPGKPAGRLLVNAGGRLDVHTPGASLGFRSEPVTPTARAAACIHWRCAWTQRTCSGRSPPNDPVNATGPVGRSTDGEQRTTSPTGTTFEAIVLAWEGTAVADLRADASGLRRRLEALSAAGVHVLVVSDEAVERNDSQLQARPRGPGTLYLCGKRGKELVAVTGDGTRPVFERTADPEENGALDRVARQTGVPPIAAHPGAGGAHALRWWLPGSQIGVSPVN